MGLGLVAKAPTAVMAHGVTQVVASCSNSAAASTTGYGGTVRFGGICVTRRNLRMSRALGTLLAVRAIALQDSLTSMDEDSEDIEDIGLARRQLQDYPLGLQRYETMAVLRPDISEEQRLELTQRYEEAIIAGGGLDVEMFNRGMQPLAYNIKTKNMGGVSNRYLDGIYFLFTYVTKPQSQLELQQKLNADDDIIRSTSFRMKV